MALTKRELSELKEVRRRLEMRDEDVCFGRPGSNTTAEVRETTRRWRESWILPVLDRIIDNNEAKHRKADAR